MVANLSVLEEYISTLQCERVEPGDKHLLEKLERFNCGNPEKKSSNVSTAMLNRLRAYIQQDADNTSMHDLYYIIHDENDIFLFFSLQASLVFSTQHVSPEDLHQLKCVYDSAMELEETGCKAVPEVNDFRIAMKMLDGFEFLGLEKYYNMDDNALNPIISLINEIIDCKKDEKQNNLYVDKIIPSIELVNFCKNHDAEEAWNRKQFGPPLVPTLFWYKILPIIYDASQIIGCVYVALYAADVTKNKDGEKKEDDEKKDGDTDDKRKLLSYYESAYSFKQDETLCALKPRYDWGCVFLCQKIKELSQKAAQFKEYFLSKPAEDDV